MILYAHQPEYFPWVGFFDKLSRCDLFIVLDSVQFEKGGFQNRNRIRTADGWRWLTVPVKRSYPQKICDVEIAKSDWAEEHARLIEMHLGNSSHFAEYYSSLQKLLNQKWSMLEDLTLNSIEYAARALGINVPTIKSSALKARGSLQSLLVEICKEVGADCYLAGSGGRAYMTTEEFENNGIKVMWHEYNHPTYRQAFLPFQSNMSVIDLLMNEGGEALRIIRSGGAAQ